MLYNMPSQFIGYRELCDFAHVMNTHAVPLRSMATPLPAVSLWSVVGVDSRAPAPALLSVCSALFCLMLPDS